MIAAIQRGFNLFKLWAQNFSQAQSILARKFLRSHLLMVVCDYSSRVSS